MLSLGWVFLLSFHICAASWWPTQTCISASKDNTLYFSSEEHQLSNGAGSTVIVGATGQKSSGQIRRTVMYFDVSTLFKLAMITGKEELTSASIEMTVRKTGPNPAQVDMFPLVQSFGAGNSNANANPGQGAPAQPGDATWYCSYYPDLRWYKHGGDFTDYPTATSFVSAYKTYEWTSPQLLQQLRNLYTQPNKDFGWLFRVRNESEMGTAKEFYGHKYGIESLRPKLILKYNAPPPVWFWYASGMGIFFILIIVGMTFWSCRKPQDSYQYSTIRDFSAIMSTPSLSELFNDPAIRIIDIGEITLGRVIGTGAFGAVFEGSLDDGTRVAIKKVNLSSDSTNGDVEAFVEEIKIMSAIAHPNLLSLFAIAFSEDCTDVILLTDLIENGSLSDLLFKRGKKFKHSEKIRIVREIAFGIHYLHSVRPRIIHRDLKSDNILVTKDFSVKIADFGMSKMIKEHSQILTRSGTPHYMAPESIREGKFSEKSDVYSFGVVVWELVSECRPFAHIQSPYQVMYKVVNEGLRPEAPEGCSPLFHWLITECTAPEASDRPSFKAILLKLNHETPHSL